MASAACGWSESGPCGTTSYKAVFALDGGGIDLDLESLAQHRGRIDLGAVATDFEMQVRAGRAAGRADQADAFVGAYAGLAYVTQAAAGPFGWITP